MSCCDTFATKELAIHICMSVSKCLYSFLFFFCLGLKSVCALPMARASAGNARFSDTQAMLKPANDSNTMKPLNPVDR